MYLSIHAYVYVTQYSMLRALTERMEEMDLMEYPEDLVKKEFPE